MDLTQQPLADRGARRNRSAHLARVILREPFRAGTWRRTAYVLLALPVGLLCVPLALVGGPAGRIQRGLARRLLHLHLGEPPRTGPVALAHAVISSPLNLMAAVTSGYFWTIVVINFGFPLRSDGEPSHSWGGPTMAGAWAVHAGAGGATFLFLTPWVVKGFTALQARLVTGFLGTDRTGLLRNTGIALGVAAVCAVLSAPIIHQL
ncbi:hypothetical protein AB0436_03345 [Streptomyces sp. NPDC051322]|uniref:hypothetical protein n=1 Tax=Streptomyces sp. NPDC051322 TaxID=3154645 RepID=UPI00344BCA98